MHTKIQTNSYRYAGIEYDDVSNGEGFGAVVFTQFCPHHCKECQNPQTWDKNGGKIFANNNMINLIKYYQDCPFAKRLTLSGGDPVANKDFSIYVIQTLKNKFPYLTIWLYTGYLFEEVKKNNLNLLKMIDVLVDGKYDYTKRDITLAWCGSSNQRVIDVQESLKRDKVILYKS